MKLAKDFKHYLLLYGFRCNNEQKLEEDDLFTRPDFIFDSLRSYLRSKKYDVSTMHQNEKELKENAEKIVRDSISGVKLFIFNRVLSMSVFAVKNRENLRFLRSRSFGINRRIFNLFCTQLNRLGVIESIEDGFYLNYTEIFDFIDGKAESYHLERLQRLEKKNLTFTLGKMIHRIDLSQMEQWVSHFQIKIS